MRRRATRASPKRIRPSYLGGDPSYAGTKRRARHPRHGGSFVRQVEEVATAALLAAGGPF